MFSTKASWKNPFRHPGWGEDISAHTDRFTYQHFQKTANFKRYWLFLEVTLFIVTEAKLSQRQFYNKLTDCLPERNCSPSFLITGRKVIGKQLS